MLHHRWFPRIELDGRDSLRRGRYDGRAWTSTSARPIAGRATLEVFDAPTEELVALAPREIIGGYFRSVGTTFAGGTTLEH